LVSEDPEGTESIDCVDAGVEIGVEVRVGSDGSGTTLVLSSTCTLESVSESDAEGDLFGEGIMDIGESGLEWSPLK